MTPYWGQGFFQFFFIFFHRLFQIVQGKIAFSDLAPDEVQIFALVLIGLSTSLVGAFLYLRKMAMIANSLTHTLLVGIILTFLLFMPSKKEEVFLNLQQLLLAAFFTACLTTFLTEGMIKIFKVQEDASIGIVFTTLFALGIVLVTLFTRNAHIGTEIIMGNLDAVRAKDLPILFWVFFLNLALFGLFFKEYKVTSFDPLFSRSIGVAAIFFHYLLMLQVAQTAIGGFRSVGVVMILGLFTGPPLIARLFSDTVLKMILLSFLITLITALLSVAFTRHFLSKYGLALSTSGFYVTLIFLFFLLAISGKGLQRKWRKVC
ncbi:MAG: metal ABC transporter permease [Simkaniaceae bacterium]